VLRCFVPERRASALLYTSALVLLERPAAPLMAMACPSRSIIELSYKITRPNGSPERKTYSDSRTMARAKACVTCPIFS
jgi:hypothetical protein